MDYVIKIGKKYIGLDNNGKYTETSNINHAFKGERQRLNNIVNNSISPSKRHQCRVVLVNSVQITSAKCNSFEKEELHTESLFDSAMEDLKKIDIITKKHDALAQKLSTIDKEICDIQHYIEFNQFNAADGYKAYKLLNTKLKERRSVKNDFYKFQMLSDSKVSDIFDGTLDEKLKNINNQKYAPRVLKELFEKDNYGID